MKKTIAAIIVLIIIGAVVYFITQDKTQEGPIKIGVSTLLSGDFAALGENIRDTAKLVVEEVNKEGGINGRQIELVIEDAGVSSKDGLSAAQKLINIDGVKYIIGGTTSNGTIASASLVDEKKVIYMTPVTGGNNVDTAGEYIFRTANADVLAGRDTADAMIKMGYKNVAIVSEVAEAMQDIKKSFVSTVETLDGKIVFSEDFPPETTDFRSIITKLKASNPQAVLIISQTGMAGAYFIKQLRELKVEVPIFTDFNFALNESATKIVGSTDGIYFADPSYGSEDKKTQDFFNKYKETYGHAPAISFHSAATYDALMMLIEAIKNVGDDSKKVHDWLLTNVKNYNGLMGTYSLDEKGNSDLGFTIKIIKNGKPTDVQF